MLIDADCLEKQLRDKKPEEAVAKAYRVLASARFFTVRPGDHGYIEHELRFEANGHWLYAAVLNKKWILWYFRKPALKQKLVEKSEIEAHFPAAEATKYGELKLRVFNAEEARAVLQFIDAESNRPLVAP